MLGTLLAPLGHLAQKRIVYCPKTYCLIAKRHVVATQKEHSYYPKETVLLPQRNIVVTQKEHGYYPKSNHSLPKEISSLPKKIKPALDFHRDMLGSGEIGGECFCFRRIICRFSGVCDTSMILLWYFIVSFSEKYHSPKMLCTKCINGKITAKMILWYFFGDF